MDPRARRRARLLLLFLLVALAYAVKHSRGGVTLALEDRLYRVLEVPLRAVAAAAASAGGWLEETFRREHLRQRIEGLEARLAALELERVELEDARRENERLGTLLGLRERTRSRGRAARVIGGDPAGSARAVVIDAGAGEGVVKDAPVVAASGLVGRVLKVGSRSAVVQVVADAASGVAAMDERSRVQGVLTGSGPGQVFLRYVQNLEDVQPGDRILASGLDGVYPKGVPVGTVAEVRPGPDAFLEVRVEPSVRLSELETVLVLGATTGGARPGRDDLAQVRAAGRGERAGR